MSEPVFHLDSDLNPTGVSIPCPAKVKAVLGLPSPVMLPCGLLDGHDGPHRYRIEWGAGAATHRNLSALSASSNDSGSVPVSGGDRARIEQRGAERVFAALSVHFAGHPDFDAVLAEFDGKGWTKEGAADLVPADDEVTVKREARADRLTEEARNVNGEAEAEVWALRVLFEEMHFEKFGTYPDYDASHEQVKACLAAWTVSKHGRRETPAPSQTEGGGPDDTKQVSKEQGASPSVPPAVTTDGVPVVREGREDGELCEACQGYGVNGPVLDARCPGCQARTCHGHSEPCDSCAATGLAPSVVSGGYEREEFERVPGTPVDPNGEVFYFCPGCNAAKEDEGVSSVACPCSRYQRHGSLTLDEVTDYLAFVERNSVSGGGQNEARIEAATKAAAAVYPEDHDPIFVNGLARKMVEAAAPFLVPASDEVTEARQALQDLLDDIAAGGPTAEAIDWAADALDKKGQDDG